PGKSVAAAWSGVGDADYEIIDDNPLFELYDPSHVLDLRLLTQIDNYVAINNAVSVDLLGQINAETTFGNFNMLNGLGGQPEAHLGGFFSRGGRAITLLPSTAVNGAVSRIVAMLEEGSTVTIPRFFADIIISEHGVAQLLGKNHRERAQEMISIAHPDHRSALQKEFERLL
ncbi:MAG: acetyl-CoA hydrolase/transferase C-terminal domain-containing protein, partial [Dehalococcoidia bacterium]